MGSYFFPVNIQHLIEFIHCLNSRNIQNQFLIYKKKFNTSNMGLKFFHHTNLLFSIVFDNYSRGTHHLWTLLWPQTD